jgi:hypothetical protein
MSNPSSLLKRYKANERGCPGMDGPDPLIVAIVDFLRGHDPEAPPYFLAEAATHAAISARVQMRSEDAEGNSSP